MKNLFFISLLWVMLANAGCVSLLVANPSPRPTGGSGTSSADARITNAVNASLVRDNNIPSVDIYVSTNKGIVTLQGYVADSLTKRRAAQVAASSLGVRSVRNKLRIK